LMGNLRLAPAIALCACAAASSPQGPVASSIAIAADEADVPADLVMAIAIEEGGVRLPALRIIDDSDPVPVGGALELRRGRVDTLALGASLAGVSEDALRVDTDLGTRAGALVIGWLGATGDPATWPAALEAMSGMDDASARDYANRVLAILTTGGDFVARDGEVLHLAPHSDLPAPAPALPTPKSDFPGAIWFTTSCTDKCTAGRPLGNAAVNKIVIHDTEGGWDGSVATLQNDSGKSVHYIVDADGSRVGQFRAETDTTWHAGNFYYNETSIGIEHVGQTSDPNGYSDALYAKSEKLVKNIRTRWNVPLDREHIIGHYQVPNEHLITNTSKPCSDPLDSCEHDDNFGGVDNHRDPGEYWQWCQYMQALGGSCTCNDAWSHWNCTTDKTEAVRCVSGTVEIATCSEGCQVMPIGTDDVCHTDLVSDPDGLESPGDASTSQHDGGCSTGGTPGPLLLLALLALRRRR
ncbi:MAG TPA: N-acetylmuramoyl-L-alanine amidase, partial [Kofleriaceae bacterium]|nr:N-acetylmuramoyl-L-alanine amidase [Kofleriaceae bacterium]